MTNINTTQKVALSIVPEDVLGHTVPNSTITGVPLWNTTNASVVSLQVAADGFSAVAFGTGAGTATVNIIANAGTVASPVQINGSIDITVTQAPATQLVVNAVVESQ